MDQWLREYTTLADGPSLVSNTYIRGLTAVYNSKGSPSLYRDLFSHKHTLTQKHMHTCNLEKNEFIKLQKS